MDNHGEFRRMDWTPQYSFVRSKLGCSSPGYVLHEAIRWSPHMRKWVFMPRRISTDPYDDVKDEKRGSNKVVIVDESFSDAKIVTVNMKKKSPGLHGFSSFAFVPGTNDRHTQTKTNMTENWNQSFEDFVSELESAEQPTCNLENPEDCEACGS